MKTEDVRRRLKEARRHLQFCVLLYNDQLARGKDFLHEHPAGASSWREGCIEVLASKSNVSTTVGHMCRYDMTLDDGSGRKLPIMKPTRWMSSSEPMLQRLNSKCKRDHKHGSLLDGRAAEAAIYPEKLCIEILKGMRDTVIKRNMDKEKKEAEQEENLINSMIYDESICDNSFLNYVGKPSRGLKGSRRAPKTDTRQHGEVSVGRRPKVLRRDYLH